MSPTITKNNLKEKKKKKLMDSRINVPKNRYEYKKPTSVSI